MSSLKRSLRRTTLVLLPLMVLGLAGCMDIHAHQSAMDPQGPVARDQFNAFMLTLYVTTFLWITVGGALIIAIFRFRAKKTDDPNYMPKQSHGNPLVEAGLIAFSTLCLVIIAVPTLKGIVYAKRTPDSEQKGAIKMTVTGYQWWFEFQYPDEGVVTANEFVVPAGRAVEITLRSGDVIHSFWLPKLAGKVDVVPGQENYIWFKADKPGYYYGQCAEFCGDSHAYMLFRCKVVSDADYKKWVAHMKTDAAIPYDAPANMMDLPDGVNADTVALAQKTFQSYCMSCHTLGRAGGKNGPNLTHIASRSVIAAGWLDFSRDNLFKWIRHPDQVKPGNYMWRGVPMPGSGVMPGLAEQEMKPDGNPVHKGPLTDEQVHALATLLSLEK